MADQESLDAVRSAIARKRAELEELEREALRIEKLGPPHLRHHRATCPTRHDEALVCRCGARRIADTPGELRLAAKLAEAFASGSGISLTKGDVSQYFGFGGSRG